MASATSSGSPSKRRPWWRVALSAIGWVFGILFVLFLIGGSGAIFLVEIPFLLGFGWIPFLRENLEAMQPNWLLVAEAGACVAALAVGGHYFARWLWREMAPEGGLPWKARWTVLGLSTVLLLFVAGIATIGLTHQATWLFNAPGPMVEDSWTNRSKITEGLSLGSQAKGAVAEHFARTGRLPDSNAEAGYEPPKELRYVESLQIGPKGVITITMGKNVGGGGQLYLTPAPAGANLDWKCTSTFRPRHVPAGCRDPSP